MRLAGRFNANYISDPIHGLIGLSQVEWAILKTPAFQRLRNVRQLGLTHYVFPHAEYSRFPHSLGTCHIAGRLLQSLINKGVDISPDEFQIYRLAALLHDVGHYPFSHIMERAIKKYYSVPKISPPHNPPVREDSIYYLHGSVGEKIIEEDPNIQKVFEEEKIDPEAVSEIYSSRSPKVRFPNLISSDLDADRIDYLLRTAHLTALPYGSHDAEYLISQISFDDISKKLCLPYKAIAAVDHFLLSRYFQYKQIIYQKTAYAIERILQDVFIHILDSEVDCTKSAIVDMIKNGGWRNFDDAFLLSKVRGLFDQTSDPVVKLKAQSILYRHPPKIIVSHEYLGRRDEIEGFEAIIRNLEDTVNQLSNSYKIPRELWQVIPIPISAITSMGGTVPVSSMIDIKKQDTELYGKSIFIKKTPQSSPVVIMEVNNSLMHALSEQYLFGVQLYILFPDDESLNRRDEIRKDILQILPHIRLV